MTQTMNVGNMNSQKKIQILSGVMARKRHKNGEDAGFIPLTPGIYFYTADSLGNMQIEKSPGKFAYLSFQIAKDHLMRGKIAILDAT